MSAELIHIEATNDQLVARAVELRAMNAQPWRSEKRKAEIGREMAHIFFELHCREQETLDEQLATATEKPA